jgi:bifunctional DNA-binding transcriptional regulator/antitoxin component of YhaV-PrlF toxin-antitoxin module
MNVKIKIYKIQQSGLRGNQITLPKVWIDDQMLSPGDQIDIYRDSEDRLILIGKKSTPKKSREKVESK